MGRPETFFKSTHSYVTKNVLFLYPKLIGMAKRPSRLLYSVRNSKLNTIFDVIEDLIAEYFVPCTQQELLFLINQQLPKEQWLTMAGLKSHLLGRESEQSTIGTIQKDNPLYELVIDMIILYRIETKKDLIEKYKRAKSGVALRKYEFLLQHKFREWNIKDQGETEERSGNGVNVTINIVPRGEATKPITTEAEMLNLEAEILNKYAERLSIPTRAED